jgi:hypothetical protein
MNGIFVAITVMNLNVGVERQRGHVEDGASIVIDVDRRLTLDRPVRLHNSYTSHRLGQIGGCVADVDLPARNVIFAPVERSRLRQTGDPMIRRRVCR